MTIVIPNAIVHAAAVGAVVQPIKVESRTLEIIKVDYMSRCIKKISPCIGQNADKTFSLQDKVTADYSNVSEYTFEIWNRVNDPAAALLTKTLTGGDIVIVGANTAQFDITNVESGTFTAGVYYCEAWVELVGGDRYPVGVGPFEVQDTRKYD